VQWLVADDLARFERRLGAALGRARATGTPVLASVTTSVAAGLDPTAIAAASRRPGEPWFCLEQPDREGSALAALGCVRTLEGQSPDRFAAVSDRWRALAAEALADPPDGPPGSGLVVLGGFAFAPDGGASPHWSGFAPASLIVPEVSLARRGDATWLTVNAEVAPDDTVQGA
jgi:isochorismate synthase EntC